LKLVYGKNKEYLYRVNYWSDGDDGFAIVYAKSVSHAELVILDKYDPQRNGHIHVYKVVKVSNLDDRILTSHVND
jgi:hypothetical protein